MDPGNELVNSLVKVFPSSVGDMLLCVSFWMADVNQVDFGGVS